jgi:MFS family permease
MSGQIKKIRSVLKGNLAVMIASSSLWSLTGNLTMPFYALYVLELGGDYAMIGKILGVSALIKIVPVILGGYLTDRIGRKRILFTMTYLMACISLIRAFAPDYRFLLIASVLEALLFGIRGPSMNSIIADSTQPETRSLSYALWIVGPRIVGILSPAFFGSVVDQYGMRLAMRWGYSSVFIAGTLSAYLRQRYITETLTEKNEVKADLAELRLMLSGFGETVMAISRQGLTFLSLDMVFTLSLGLSDPYLVTYATDSLGLSFTQWGTIMTLVSVLNCVVILLVASPSDDQGRVKFVLASMISWPITYLLFINSGSYLQILLARLAITVSSGVGQPAWHAMFVDYCPKEHRGRYNALLEIAWSVLYGGGSWLGGMLYQNVGIKTPFQVAIALMSVGSVAALLYLKEPEVRAE